MCMQLPDCKEVFGSESLVGLAGLSRTNLRDEQDHSSPTDGTNHVGPVDRQGLFFSGTPNGTPLGSGVRLRYGSLNTLFQARKEGATIIRERRAQDLRQIQQCLNLAGTLSCKDEPDAQSPPTIPHPTPRPAGPSCPGSGATHSAGNPSTPSHGSRKPSPRSRVPLAWILDMGRKGRSSSWRGWPPASDQVDGPRRQGHHGAQGSGHPCGPQPRRPRLRKPFGSSGNACEPRLPTWFTGSGDWRSM